MDYTLVSPQPRGQITLPVKLRKKYGIKPGVQVIVEDLGDKIALRPLTNPLVIMPKYSREEINDRLSKITKARKVLWTEEDDKQLAMLRKKDNQYLNW